MERKIRFTALVFLVLYGLSSCSSNPIGDTNKPTGSPAGLIGGAAIAGGGAALLGAPKAAVAALGIGGAALGYYLTTTRYASSGIVQAGGQVYTLGSYVGIEIP